MFIVVPETSTSFLHRERAIRISEIDTFCNHLSFPESVTEIKLTDGSVVYAAMSSKDFHQRISAALETSDETALRPLGHHNKEFVISKVSSCIPN